MIDRRPEGALSRRAVTVIGGGTGSFNLLVGLRPYEHLRLHCIVTMTDSGGDSGRLRAEFKVLPPGDHPDDFVAAVLAPEHPLIVVVHDEMGSQLRNPFEQDLVAPVLAALAERGFDATNGLGVVVPHRAQRAALQGELVHTQHRRRSKHAKLLAA